MLKIDINYKMEFLEIPVIIGIILVIILAFFAIGLIIWALAFFLRYLTLPLAGILLITTVFELTKGKSRKNNDLIITCIVLIPILCFVFLEEVNYLIGYTRQIKKM